MANINVTYEEMRSAADQLTTGQDDIDTRLGDLERYIDSLVADGYVTSSSSGAFRDQFATFTTSARQTVSALEGLARFLRSAADTLEQTDEQLAASIRGQ